MSYANVMYNCGGCTRERDAEPRHETHPRGMEQPRDDVPRERTETGETDGPNGRPSVHTRTDD